MVKTRSMRNRHPTKTVRKIYRRRVKNSRCRKKGESRCRSLSNCKFVRTSKRRYCRMSSNRDRLARRLGRGRGKRTRKRR